MTFKWTGTNLSLFCPGLVKAPPLEINYTQLVTSTEATTTTTESAIELEQARVVGLRVKSSIGIQSFRKCQKSS